MVRQRTEIWDKSLHLSEIGRKCHVTSARSVEDIYLNVVVIIKFL
jgi:hypothetical protein